MGINKDTYLLCVRKRGNSVERAFHNRQGRSDPTFNHQQSWYWPKCWWDNENPSGIINTLKFKTCSFFIFDYCLCDAYYILDVAGITVHPGEPWWSLPCRMETRGEVNETWPQAQQRVFLSYLEISTKPLLYVSWVFFFLKRRTILCLNLRFVP